MGAVLPATVPPAPVARHGATSQTCGRWEHHSHGARTVWQPYLSGCASNREAGSCLSGEPACGPAPSSGVTGDRPSQASLMAKRAGLGCRAGRTVRVDAQCETSGVSAMEPHWTGWSADRGGEAPAGRGWVDTARRCSDNLLRDMRVPRASASPGPPST